MPALLRLLYVNAYLVTSHHGGEEEGGWAYDAGEPLASIPLEAREVPVPLRVLAEAVAGARPFAVYNRIHRTIVVPVDVERALDLAEELARMFAEVWNLEERTTLAIRWESTFAAAYPLTPPTWSERAGEAGQ